MLSTHLPVSLALAHDLTSHCVTHIVLSWGGLVLGCIPSKEILVFIFQLYLPASSLCTVYDTLQRKIKNLCPKIFNGYCMKFMLSFLGSIL